MLKKVLLAILDNFEGYVSQVLLAFFVLILLLQIFLRQFGHPLYWTEELARYSFVWFVFSGLPTRPASPRTTGSPSSSAPSPNGWATPVCSSATACGCSSTSSWSWKASP